MLKGCNDCSRKSSLFIGIAHRCLFGFESPDGSISLGPKRPEKVYHDRLGDAEEALEGFGDVYQEEGEESELPKIAVLDDQSNSGGVHSCLHHNVTHATFNTI